MNERLISNLLYVSILNLVVATTILVLVFSNAITDRRESKSKTPITLCGVGSSMNEPSSQ